MNIDPNGLNLDILQDVDLNEIVRVFSFPWTSSEKIARERKCTFATVNTMDWEALPFYQKLGYSIEFVREGYDKASKMYLLRKEL